MTPMVIFLDTETTGLDPARCQVLEVGLVPVVAGRVRDELAAECHVEHEHLCYQPGRLRLMGHGLDRRDGVEAVPAAALDGWLCSAFNRCLRAAGAAEPVATAAVVLGGKNVAGFDLPFLRPLCPHAARRVRHRVVDVAGLCLRPDDAVPPDLAECLRRSGYAPEVAHAALADARACAAVYAQWVRSTLATERLIGAMAERCASQSRLLTARAERGVA